MLAQGVASRIAERMQNMVRKHGLAHRSQIPIDEMNGAGQDNRMTATSVNLVSHPLIQHKLSLMRERDCSIKSFRELLNEIGMLLCYEVTRDLPLELVDIETPLTAMKAPKISGKKLTFAPILRAGIGFLDGMLALVPSARVAHIGLYRDPETLQAVEYFFKAPHDLSDRTVIMMDPMLATGNSACAAAALLKTRGARDIRFVCLLAAPEGIAQFQSEHADVPIWTAAIDERLNDHGYIVPGLGDAGDRMFGTK
jgi:uracil phosphoribosyltransferase